MIMYGPKIMIRMFDNVHNKSNDPMLRFCRNMHAKKAATFVFNRYFNLLSTIVFLPIKYNFFFMLYKSIVSYSRIKINQRMNFTVAVLFLKLAFSARITGPHIMKHEMLVAYACLLKVLSPNYHLSVFNRVYHILWNRLKYYTLKGLFTRVI